MLLVDNHSCDLFLGQYFSNRSHIPKANHKSQETYSQKDARELSRKLRGVPMKTTTNKLRSSPQESKLIKIKSEYYAHF